MRFKPPVSEDTALDACYDQAEHDAIEEWLDILDYIQERDGCSLSQARKTFDKEYSAAYNAVYC